MGWPITPSGTIVLCRQVPLDRQHNNVVDFPDAATQASAIRVFEKTEFNNYSYVGNGRVAVECARDDIIMCNYLMYKNTGFSNRWFYAFITELNYINNDTTEIVFEIDNYQTYMFDYSLQRCYVEREHSLTDNIGDNLVPENLDIGEYVQDALTPFTNLTGDAFIIATKGIYHYYAGTNTWDAGTTATMYKPMGEYSGLQVHTFFTYVYNGQTTTGLDMCRFFLNEMERIGKMDDIVSITVVPVKFMQVYDSPNAIKVDSNGNVREIECDINVADQLPVEIHIDFNTFSWAGKTYQPKNNKLHTYPYKMLYMTTLDGQAKEYRWEFFNSTPNVYFWWRGTVGSESALIAAPINYKQSGTNYDEKIVLTNFPNVSCTSDAWLAYLAQNANKNSLTNLSSGLTIAGGLATAIAGAVSMNPTVIAGGLAAAYGGVNAIAKLNAQIQDVKAQPDNAHGSQSVPALYAVGLKNIYYTNKRITPEFAEIIDNYFTMFGYACHKVKVPNTTSRPEWNYVKTVDCNIVATSSVDDLTGLDASAVDDIKAIYNKGVTIWHHMASVGHYELTNAPTP